MSASDPVWTALRWQVRSRASQCWLVRPCVRPVRAVHGAAGHNAIRAERVPTNCAHSRCWVVVGFPASAVLTGFVHQLLFALSNIVSAGSRPRLCSYAASGSR